MAALTRFWSMALTLLFWLVLVKSGNPIFEDDVYHGVGSYCDKNEENHCAENFQCSRNFCTGCGYSICCQSKLQPKGKRYKGFSRGQDYLDQNDIAFLDKVLEHEQDILTRSSHHNLACYEK